MNHSELDEFVEAYCTANGITDLRPEIENAIRWTVKQTSLDFDLPHDAYIAAIELEEDPE